MIPQTPDRQYGPPPSDDFVHPDTLTCQECGKTNDTVVRTDYDLILCEFCQDLYIDEDQTPNQEDNENKTSQK